MDKAQFRKKYKDLRKELAPEVISDYSLSIANRALELPIWEGTYYHLFLTISEKKEVDTQFLLHILQGRDKSVVVSKTNFESFELEHFLLQENTRLAISTYGIPEPIDGIEVGPQKLDIVFVPLLTFDTFGNRIGYGKGFYDRFLAECSSDTIFVGLSLFEPEEEIPFSSDDIKLHYCISPSKTFHF